MDRSSGLMRDYRNPGMESWRPAEGTMGCWSGGGFLMTEHTQETGAHSSVMMIHFEGCF